MSKEKYVMDASCEYSGFHDKADEKDRQNSGCLRNC